MSMENAQPRPEPEGCLTAAVRIPVRIVVLVVVVPVRMVWDLLVVTARALDRVLLRPLARAAAWLFRYTVTVPLGWLAEHVLVPVLRGLVMTVEWLARALFVWPWVGLWRYVVVPVWRYGVVVPAGWLYRVVLAPVGRGLGRFFGVLGRGAAVAGVWLARALFVWPWVGLWRYVVVPVWRYGVVVPAGWLYRVVLAPVGRGLGRFFGVLGRGAAVAGVWLARALFVWPWVGLWRYVVVPVCRYGIGVPAGWLYRAVLVPLGTGLGHLARWTHRWVIAPAGRALALGLTGLGHALTWLGKALFVWPWVGAWRYLLVPVVRYGVVVPLGWVGRHVLVPLARELLDALTFCWRIAGFVSRAVWRALGRAAWNLVGRPAAWFYRSVCTPLGHWTRDRIWAPARTAAVEAGRVARDALATARATVRQARRDAWHALVGGPRVTEPVEPVVAPARTLGSTTNASGAVPAPEISLRKRG
ncbi:hypothetical protein ABZZ37_00045 [Streptomyces sp. NPDC006464]|uniref:hypothetical protein n=1 Tax=Streptomyces sp. NPDC006464 TaxID=3154305 RepID=UPI0033A7C8CC